MGQKRLIGLKSPSPQFFAPKKRIMGKNSSRATAHCQSIFVWLSLTRIPDSSRTWNKEEKKKNKIKLFARPFRNAIFKIDFAHCVDNCRQIQVRVVKIMCPRHSALEYLASNESDTEWPTRVRTFHSSSFDRILKWNLSGKFIEKRVCRIV